MVKSILNGTNLLEIIKDETLATIFRETARKYQNKTALIYKDKNLSYKQLDEWSDAIAVFLFKKGIGNGKPVGVCLPRGLELHVTILGIIKSGASYVPMDYEIPQERIEIILEEVNAVACFTDKTLKSDILLFQPVEQNTFFNKEDLPAILNSNNWAYVLYTSGSTGKPKGIPINQKQISHFIRAEQSILQIQSNDKVYQGFSVSFDMWCEETWISYLAGATIWIADTITAKSIDELPNILEKENITILHAVPSLLAAMPRDVPSIRLVNSGGEACSSAALTKWAKNNRQFYNSYGPTETTVTACIAKLDSQDTISIGTPLPNYSLAIVDKDLKPVEIGNEGELIISGIGVAEGYVNLPNQTKDKFLDKTDTLEELFGDKIYKTGDLALMTQTGTIEFVGRIDDQVKIHGYRIELGEIENKLIAISGILEAACNVFKNSKNQEILVAFIKTKSEIQITEVEIKHNLACYLPNYMIPSSIVFMDELPRLASGKINRKALVFDEKRQDSSKYNSEELKKINTVEGKVKFILNELFPGKKINLEQDFFNDIGGDSFTSAWIVSEMREFGGIEKASFRDIYVHRPLGKLIDFWEGQQNNSNSDSFVIQEDFKEVKTSSFLLCGIAQSVALVFIFAVFALQIFLPYLGYSYVYKLTTNHFEGILVAFGIFCLITPLFYLINIITKWLVIGKMKEGDYPLWGVYYFRWWLVKNMKKLMTIDLLADTPIYAFFLRGMGTKIGKNAQFSLFNIGAEDLVTIGDDVSISSNVLLDNAYIENGYLRLRKIQIGNHAYIGSSSVIGPNTIMEEWSDLQDLSSLLPNQIIPEKEIWQGSPACKVKIKSHEEIEEPLQVSNLKRTIYILAFSCIFLIFPVAVLIPLIPTFIVLNSNNYSVMEYLYIIPLLALGYIITFLIQTIISSRILLYNIKPGVYNIFSFLYLRKWLSDQLMQLSLTVLHPIYATVYVSSMFRALGAKVGKKTEISTASGITYPLLEIGDGGFIADLATIGETDVRGLRFTLKKTIIKDMSFVGNCAVIPQGYELESNMLIGVLSTPPSTEELNESEARNWFGSPAIPLPRRQETELFPESLTINPSNFRIFKRGFVEFIRILLPTSVSICLSIIFISCIHTLIETSSIPKILILFPFFYLAIIAIPSFLLTVILKWIFVGRYKKQQIPMWTSKVWLSEGVTSIYESLAVPYLLDLLTGTFWLPLSLRMLGVKIGKRVCMNTTDITEFDVVSIGDDSVLNDDCGPQTHLFEDRIMKIGQVSIGKRCSIGSQTIILYDSKVEDNANILSLSLVMKGETISKNKKWVGSPVELLT